MKDNNLDIREVIFSIRSEEILKEINESINNNQKLYIPLSARSNLYE